jgi:hypothetical protein
MNCKQAIESIEKQISLFLPSLRINKEKAILELEDLSEKETDILKHLIEIQIKLFEQYIHEVENENNKRKNVL